MGNKPGGAAAGGQPTGTDFKSVQKDRQKYHDVDLPDIPFNKMKEVTAEVDMTVKQSKFLEEYKREFRDALKRKKAKGHEPRLARLTDKALHPADDAVGKDEDRKALIKLLIENITPVVEDDVKDGLKEDGVKGDHDKLSKDIIGKLIYERVHGVIEDVALKIFRKYQQGKDFEASDGEEEDSSALEEAKAERARKAAKQRAYERAVWLAEANGEEPPSKPDDDGEEEDDEEEEEEEDDEE